MMGPEEFVDLVTGELCPCGHRRDEHSEPDPHVDLEGLTEVMGACTNCDCAGVVE